MHGAGGKAGFLITEQQSDQISKIGHWMRIFFKGRRRLKAYFLYFYLKFLSSQMFYQYSLSSQILKELGICDSCGFLVNERATSSG